MGLTGSYQTQIFNGGRTNLTVDGDLVIHGELNKGRLSQIDSIATEVSKLRRISETFSQPGMIWNTSAFPGPANLMFGVAFCPKHGGVFVAVGDVKDIRRSTDNGVTWSAAIGNPFAAGTQILSIVWIDDGSSWGVFVIVGAVGAGGLGQIARSTDGGATWGVLIANNFVVGIRTVASNGSRLVAMDGSGNSSYSDDYGATWSALSISGGTGATGTRALFYGNGAFVFADSGGHVFTSAAGAVWTDRGAVSTGFLITCTFINGIFFVGGQNAALSAVVFSSKDNGATWAAVTIPATLGAYVRTIMSANDTIIANGATAVTIVSKDFGATWTAIPGPNTAYFYDISFGNNTFVSTYPMWSSWLTYGKTYAYVPVFTNFGVVTNITFYWQRPVGSNTIKIWGNANSGNPGAGAASISLPVGLVSDFGLFHCGSFVFNTGTSTPKAVGIVVVGDSNLYFNLIDNAVAQIGTAITSAGTAIGVSCEVPVSGWN